MKPKMDGWFIRRFLKAAGCAARHNRDCRMYGVRELAPAFKAAVAMFAFAAVFAAGAAQAAATWNVPAQGTLNWAIGQTQEGDSILLASGTCGSISTDNKSITIRGMGGAAVAIIDGGGSHGGTLDGFKEAIELMKSGQALRVVLTHNA